MKRFLMLALFMCAPAVAPALAHANGDFKPDDMIAVNLSTEGWVTTKTARVTINVNAAVSGDAAGSARDSMIKSVNQLAAVEWRIINFNRSTSEAGLESWFAQFEARLPETSLNGLNDKAKKASKPGLQMEVGEVDFTPTLAENEAVRTTLRKTIMEQAVAELKNIQAVFPDRNYRIASINFGYGGMPGMVAAMAPRAMMMQKAEMADAGVSSDSGMQTAQRMQVTAQVTFAALAPTTPAAATAAK